MKRWLGLLTLAIPGLGIVFLDQSILPVALPTIQKQFNAGSIALQWTVNSYLLATTIFVLVGGKISDRIGHRNAFILGMLIFAISSLLCGISQSVFFLIGSRFLQGCGAALTIPAQTALVAHLFEPHERGRATGFSVSISSLFLILGPLVGGYLTQEFSWRWIFWINLPILAIGVIASLFLLPVTEKGNQKIDLPGFFYFATASSSLIILCMEGRVWGWGSLNVMMLLFVTILGFILLFRREKRTKHPFLDLSLFKQPVFAAINISISVTAFVLMVGIFRAVYVQNVLQYSPFEAGLLTFIASMPILFLAPIGGYLSDKMTPKLPVALGYLCLIFSFFWLGVYSYPTLTFLLVGFIVFGIGIPFIFTPSYSSAMSAVPRHKIGVAFGMVTSLRTFASTAGIAFIGALMGTIEDFQFAKTGNSELAKISSFSITHYALGCLMIVAFAIVFIFYNLKSKHEMPKGIAEGFD